MQGGVWFGTVCLSRDILRKYAAENHKEEQLQLQALFVLGQSLARISRQYCYPEEADGKGEGGLEDSSSTSPSRQRDSYGSEASAYTPPPALGTQKPIELLRALDELFAEYDAYARANGVGFGQGPATNTGTGAASGEYGLSSNGGFLRRTLGSFSGNSGGGANAANVNSTSQMQSVPRPKAAVAGHEPDAWQRMRAVSGPLGPPSLLPVSAMQAGPHRQLVATGVVPMNLDYITTFVAVLRLLPAILESMVSALLNGISNGAGEEDGNTAAEPSQDMLLREMLVLRAARAPPETLAVDALDQRLHLFLNALTSRYDGIIADIAARELDSML